MNRDSQDSELEFVLDQRKLILAFLLLICICGGFFIVGFIEGKRQGVQEGSQIALETARPQTNPYANPAENSKSEAESGAEQGETGTSRQALDWYKNVNNRGEAESDLTEAARKPEAVPGKVVISSQPGTAIAPPEKAPAAAAAVRPRTAPASSYSVQVGAFRQRQEVETKAEMLRAKGYDCFIEAPKPPLNLYLLKVGKFGSRAEAASMQLKLRKDGFTTFIKANN